MPQTSSSTPTTAVGTPISGVVPTSTVTMAAIPKSDIGSLTGAITSASVPGTTITTATVTKPSAGPVFPKVREFSFNIV